MSRPMIVLLLLPLILMGSGAFSERAAGAAPQQLVIATATMGGAYYPIGGKLAGLWSRVVPGVEVTAQVTAGGFENVRLLVGNKVEIAIIPSDMAYSAANGLPPFVDKAKKPLKYDLPFICNLHSSVIQFLALRESPIKSVRDVKGKRVAVGAPGSSVEIRSRMVLEAYGYKYDRDVKPIFVGAEESTQILKDGLADAACLTAGIPTAAVMDIATFKPTKLISIDDDAIAKMLKDSPYMIRFVIPKETYRGMEADCPTVAVTGQLYASAKLNADTVFRLTKALFENAEEVRKAHGSTALWNKEFALGLRLTKFHPGAEKYYKEAGLIK